MDLSKLTTDGRAMFLAYDHGVEHGPIDLVGKSIDPGFILDIADRGGYNAVVLQKGIAEKYYVGSQYQNKIPLIIKLNGKTKLVAGEAISRQVCSIEEAIQLGAVAVGYTIYLGSEYESEMLEEFGKIEEEAHQKGLAVIGWMYPRGKSIKDDSSPEIVAYAARMGLEMGADIVKIKYCGSEECFRKAVEAAGKTKVVLSGGAKTKTPEEFLEVVKNVMSAGAIGVAVGRNVWQSKDPIGMSQKIKSIIFT